MGLGGVSVKVGSMLGVTVVTKSVGVRDMAAKVAVIGGGRIMGVAVYMEGVDDENDVGGV